MKIEEKIAMARRSINLTQDQLAELLEVTRQTISKWESGLAFPETAKISEHRRLQSVPQYIHWHDKRDDDKI